LNLNFLAIIKTLISRLKPLPQTKTCQPNLRPCGFFRPNFDKLRTNEKNPQYQVIDWSISHQTTQKEECPNFRQNKTPIAFSPAGGMQSAFR
jgi:hypothetical protein